MECRPRGGLPHFFAKARTDADIRVAYLGGSITAAPGWRVYSLDGFKRQFPKARFTEINAAIGGTGSDLGAFRVGRDVIAHKPDLVFIEFAVNDGGADPDRVQASMEGIVRQILHADPATDICFVYTLSEPMLPDLAKGVFPKAASAAPATRTLPDPLRSDHWESAKLIPIDETMLRGPWRKVEPATDERAKAFQARLPVLWKAEAPGAELAVAFEGTLLSLYDLAGPGGGVVSVSVDGNGPKSVPRFDGYCTYWRITQLTTGTQRAGRHLAVFTLEATKPDKAALLFERNRADYGKHPEKYADHTWYVSSLLLLGDMLPQAAGATNADDAR